MLVAFAIVACVLGVLAMALALYGMLGPFGGVLGLLIGVGLLVVAPLVGMKRVERWLERDAPIPWQARAKVLGVVGALAFAALVSGAWTELRAGLTRFAAAVRSTPSDTGTDAGADASADATGDAAEDAPVDRADSPAEAAVDAPPAPPEDRAARWSVPKPFGWALGDGGGAAILTARDQLRVVGGDGTLRFDRNLPDLELDRGIGFDEARGVVAIAYAGKPAAASVILFDAASGNVRWRHAPARKRATRVLFGAPGQVLFFDDVALTALDEAKGTELWSVPLDATRKPGASAITTAEVLGDRALVTIVSSDPRESELRVLDGDGGVAWKLTQPGVLTTLAVSGGPYVLSSTATDGGARIEARDLVTGDVRFEQRVGDGGLAALGEVGAGGLAVAREGEMIVARDVQTGATRFELPAPTGSAFLVSPRQPGVVLVTSSAGDTTLSRHDETGARKAFVRVPFAAAPLAACDAGVLVESLREGDLRFLPW